MPSRRSRRGVRGNTWENPGKTHRIGGFHGKITGKPRKNGGLSGKIHGKMLMSPAKNHGVEWDSRENPWAKSRINMEISQESHGKSHYKWRFQSNNRTKALGKPKESTSKCSICFFN